MKSDILLAIIISFVLKLMYTHLKINEELDDFAEDIAELFGAIVEEEIVNEDNEEE